METERDIRHKVGVKLFSTAQLENVLPTYENLFHKIDKCRSVAKEEMRKSEKRHYQYNLMYDNVFSILGKRGTGKTSVVFTLQKMIRDKYGKENSDVVLPLIIPEIIPDNCTVLGWILAIVREEVGKLESRISMLERESREENYLNRCRYNGGKTGDEGLVAQLDSLSQLFYAGNYNPSNEGSYYRAVDNSVLQAMDYYRFAQGMANFWDAWVREIWRLRKLEGKSGEICPLIYFIFDDVDLSPEKIDELLSVIIKYLSHPNIIVLTTADEELFLEVIEKRLDRNIGRLPAELRKYLTAEQNKYIMWSAAREGNNQLQKDKIDRTTRMYLGKVLPASTRYYLRLFNTARQKALFCLTERKSLARGVSEQVQRLISSIGCEQQKNFMETDDVITNFYLKFMGNTSRQIANVYIALQELVDNLINIFTKQQEDRLQNTLAAIYQNCRYFLCIAIRANHDLAEVIENVDDFVVDDFVDEIFLPEYNQWKMYYNYAFLNEFLEKELGQNKREYQQNIEICLQLYALLAFQEGLLLILEEKIKGGITQRKKIHAVPFLVEYIERIYFRDRAVLRDDLEPYAFFRHYDNLLDRLPVIVTDTMSDKKFHMEYFYDLTTYRYKGDMGVNELLKMRHNNRKWFNEMTGMLFMVYGNAYLFERRDIENCLIYTGLGDLTGYQIEIFKAMDNNIVNCFSLLRMQSGWQAEIFDSVINDVVEESASYTRFVESIREQLAIGDRNQIPLREVLKLVFDRGQGQSDNLLESKSFCLCSQTIRKNIVNNRDKLGDREMKKSLMLEYIQKVQRADAILGRERILFGPESLSSILNRLMESSLWTEKASEILYELKEAKSIDENGSVILSKKLYADITRLLRSVAEGMSGAEENIFDGNEVSAEEVKEILANMDISISLEDTQELQDAVELGLQVLVVLYFQRAYILQTICERYDSHNNMSSRALEKTLINGVEADTYYYQLFNLMVGVAEGQEISDIPSETGLILATEGEMEGMRGDIRVSYSRERRRYVNLLTLGVKDE